MSLNHTEELLHAVDAAVDDCVRTQQIQYRFVLPYWLSIGGIFDIPPSPAVDPQMSKRIERQKIANAMMAQHKKLCDLWVRIGGSIDDDERMARRRSADEMMEQYEKLCEEWVSGGSLAQKRTADTAQTMVEALADRPSVVWGEEFGRSMDEKVGLVPLLERRPPARAEHAAFPAAALRAESGEAPMVDFVPSAGKSGTLG